MENPDIELQIDRNTNGLIIGMTYKVNSREKDEGRAAIEMQEIIYHMFTVIKEIVEPNININIKKTKK